MVGDQYNSLVCQAKVKGYLSSLRVYDLVKGGVDVPAALEKVYNLITKLSRQVPASHRSEHHKVELLRNATVGYKRLMTPLSRIAVHDLSFQMLYGEQEASLQLHKDTELAEIRNCASTVNIFQDNETLGIDYAGQDRYANNPKSVCNKTGPMPQSVYQLLRLNIAGCFNCGHRNHTLRECTKPINAVRAASKKLKYSQKNASTRHAIHLISADLCGQVSDDYEDEIDRSEADGNDLEIFQAAVATSSYSLTGLFVTAESESQSNEIFVKATFSSPSWASSSPVKFQGACIDSGAEKTVIGLALAEAYCSLITMDMNKALRGNFLTFTFGSKKHSGLAYIKITIPVFDFSSLALNAHIVNIDVPLVLGLDILTRARIILNFSDDTVRSKTDNWQMPLIRKNGHVLME